MAVPAYSNDELNLCSVCFERFELEFTESKWMLVDCIKLEGLLYHPACVKNAWKGVAISHSINPDRVKISPSEIYVPVETSDESDEDVCDCTQCDRKKSKTCSLI